MIKLAWRNMWRNKRRTLITSASVFVAVFLAIIMRGFKIGQWNMLINSVLHSYTGYIQIHHKGYWDNRTFDYTMAENNPVISQCKKIKGIKALIPRLESFSLASAGIKTKGVITVGVDPHLEKDFTNLNHRLVAGHYFSNGDKGVILSQRLAHFLKLSVNDSIVLLSQGYEGMEANGIFRIIGIVHLPSPEFDNKMVFMPLRVAQDFYSAPNRITSWVVDLTNPRYMGRTIRRIHKIIDDKPFEVMSWKEMLLALYQQYISNQGANIILISLLYLIVGFGVFGTVLMMIAERKHEFAIMVTLGMRYKRLLYLLGTELLMVCLLGLISGFLGSIPVVAYFHFYPIHVSGQLAKSLAAFGMEPVLPVAWQLHYMLNQVYVIFAMVIVTLSYPMYTVYRLDLTKAMRR